MGEAKGFQDIWILLRYSPFPRQAGRKGHRKRTTSPMMDFSSTGRGKRPSQAHAKSHDCLFLDRQGEKGIASARQVSWLPFPRQAGGKKPSQAHAKSRDGLFLDRQGEKAIRALWTQRKPAKSEQHLTFPSACRGKGLYPSKIRASWRHSPSPSGEKGKSRAVNIAGDWPFPSP